MTTLVFKGLMVEADTKNLRSYMISPLKNEFYNIAISETWFINDNIYKLILLNV